MSVADNFIEKPSQTHTVQHETGNYLFDWFSNSVCVHPKGSNVRSQRLSFELSLW